MIENDDAVEVEIGAMAVSVRNSQQDGLGYNQPKLEFDFDTWGKFVKGVKEGMYDVPNTIPLTLAN